MKSAVSNLKQNLQDINVTLYEIDELKNLMKASESGIGRAADRKIEELQRMKERRQHFKFKLFNIH